MRDTAGSLDDSATTLGSPFAHPQPMEAKRSVYVLQSQVDATRYYTGLTSNVAARLAAHNTGQCTHTASGRPWRLVVIMKFLDEERAVRFERYLKSGSGCAFAKRHFR
jgi:predicted GIY-YIG superfamily endonuclease